MLLKVVGSLPGVKSQPSTATVILLLAGAVQPVDVLSTLPWYQLVVIPRSAGAKRFGRLPGNQAAGLPALLLLIF
jgi:hypothetical protein